jgi:hypothetical protein
VEIGYLCILDRKGRKMNRLQKRIELRKLIGRKVEKNTIFKEWSGGKIISMMKCSTPCKDCETEKVCFRVKESDERERVYCGMYVKGHLKED